MRRAMTRVWGHVSVTPLALKAPNLRHCSLYWLLPASMRDQLPRPVRSSERLWRPRRRLTQLPGPPAAGAGISFLGQPRSHPLRVREDQEGRELKT